MQFDWHAGTRGARHSLHDTCGAGPGAGARAGGVTGAGGGGGVSSAGGGGGGVVSSAGGGGAGPSDGQRPKEGRTSMDSTAATAAALNAAEPEDIVVQQVR
jgi:hypothetical protein